MSRRGKGSFLNVQFNRQLVILIFAMSLMPAVSRAQGTALSVYPSNGQSAEQQARDKQECAQWAASQAGPSSGMAAPATSTYQPRGQVVRGAARGAAAGAVGGAIAGDASKGAAAGAAVGGAAGGLRRGRARREERRQASTQVAASSGPNDYNRAIATCLQGRGYTVN
jgi:hypothetical protein